MDRAAQNRILAIVLAVATLVICVLGALNYVRESGYDVPTDGVWWMEVDGGLRADRVPADSPAQREGVRTGDLLVAANSRPTPTVAPLMREMARSGVYGSISYTLQRGGQQFGLKVILEPTDRTRNQGLRLIALVYLAIGLYVLFRRWTAPKATHFYVFCLVSGVFYAFKSVGQFDGLDWTFFWGNAVAAALQPALFLHFAITFGQARISALRRLGAVLLYIPGIALIALKVWAMQELVATQRLQHRLDQIDVGYQALYYVIAAIVFWQRYRATNAALERQQLKWLSRGTLLSVVPFTTVYAIPFLLSWPIFPAAAKLATFALIFLPLTFAWAIVRYRLMDTDLIFKRGVTYTLATAALVGVYFAIVGISAEVVHARLPNLRIWGLLAAIIATALIFEPIKAAIQARVDRVFDQKRFDYRETLIEFSRGLSSQTDPETLARTIVDRLSQALLVERVALFIAPAASQQAGAGAPVDTFRLAASHGFSPDALAALPHQTSAASFLQFGSLNTQGHLFFENAAQLPHLSEDDQRLSRQLDLNYYLPCRIGEADRPARTIAVIGLGRTREGDFLSSEDMELLESLAGYIGIAIQNAQLFASLEVQRAEFERLKEFNENIVESIKVGIFALDLDDRVESWNAEMEVMYAMSRAEALGRHISEIFPAEFVAEFEHLHRQTGTHHLSKVKLPLRTGEVRTANLAIAPLLTRDFVSVGSIVLVEDITERTQLESQLTQAEKLSSIGLLAAGVAHEVNTPLAVISSYAQMLQKQARGDDPTAQRLRPVLEKITQQTFRASEIVNGLLNFSRATGSEMIALDLNAVARETLTLLDHQLRTARLQVHTALAEPLPRIRGSHGKLQQVVLNLVLNAKDAMIENGGTDLFVSTETAGDDIVLTVRDTGGGIAPEHLHRIYDPFFTTKNTPKPGQHKGTGLGLAVSYGIVQEHGGRIQVESEVGQGTAFRLVLPILRPAGSRDDSGDVQRTSMQTFETDDVSAGAVHA
ncbi:ATP-binding protein [Terriglobus aquaticus]|uniref:histidine kinase n=1 Tax=Terriglobus aquaticus TaxID=940139 RepID=A0ABW9KLC0_9BACT|nr:ATP-binding protein [Terriglobus aquaticus]